MNYGIIRFTLGWVLNIEGACLLLPIICALIYHEQCVWSFAVCAFLCFAIGMLLIVRKPRNKNMYAKEGYVIVALSWMVISIFGALPFVFSGAIPNFINSLFETVSGFTTTGASILSDVESLPRAAIFWRSFTHWIGGMGVLVFLVALLPLSGGQNMYLLRAESPGPSVTKLVPRVKSTAKILYVIYIAFTAFEIILLLIGKLGLFDAMTISFGTAGTGGFSIKNSGMADYSSYIQIVVTVFMLLFGVDFSLYYLILMKKASAAFKSSEVKVYFSIVIVAVVIIYISCRGYFENVFEGIKHVAFQVASIITTTGYSTVDFDMWPQIAKTVLIMLMFIGACAGSTGGGIKVSRIIILAKTIVKEIKTAAHPKSTHKVTMNGRVVEHEVVRAVNVFIMSYVAIFFVSWLIISIDNMSFASNFTAVAATINNIGPGLEAVGPMQNFAAYSDLSKVVLIVDMLIGRLEIFPILILFSPYTWKK